VSKSAKLASIFNTMILYFSVFDCGECVDIIVSNNDCAVLTGVNINTAVDDLAQLSAYNCELIQCKVDRIMRREGRGMFNGVTFPGDSQ